MISDPCVLVTAVRTETRAVLETLRNVRRSSLAGVRRWQGRSPGRSVIVVEAGIGRSHARRALEAVPPPHGPVICVGFAGALVSAAKPGDVVLPTSIVWEEQAGLQRYEISQPAWQRIEGHVATMNCGTLWQGPILSSPTIIASPDDKHDACLRTGAVAVEMEAAGLVPVVRERGVELFVVRAVLDTADVSLADLPSELDSSWAARAELFRRPRAWVPLWKVARHIPRASRNLREAMTAVWAAL